MLRQLAVIALLMSCVASSLGCGGTSCTGRCEAENTYCHGFNGDCYCSAIDDILTPNEFPDKSPEFWQDYKLRTLHLKSQPDCSVFRGAVADYLTAVLDMDYSLYTQMHCYEGKNTVRQVNRTEFMDILKHYGPRN